MENNWLEFGQVITLVGDIKAIQEKFMQILYLI